MTPAAGRLLRALADPTRRAILERLIRGGAQSVHALTVRAGVSQPAVSKHLKLLKRAGLVRGQPSGREVYYRAEPRRLAPLADWLNLCISQGAKG